MRFVSLMGSRHRVRGKRRVRRNMGKGKGRYGRHRLSVAWGRKGWTSVPHGLLTRGTRINARRRRRHARRNPTALFNPRRYRRFSRRYRRNPGFSPKGILRSLTSKDVLMQGASIGGGLVAGFALMPVVNQLLATPKVGEKPMVERKYLGIVHIALGALMFAFLKNRFLKNAGLTIAGTGVYDLAVQNIPYLTTDLNLPPLPTKSDAVTGMFTPDGASASYIGRRPVSPSALAASYNSRRSSSGIASLAGSNPYSEIGVEW